MSTPPPRTSTYAIASLVCGSLAWLALPLIGAVLAVVFGHLARGEIQRSFGALDGDGLAIAGLTLGYLQLLLMAAALAMLLLFFGGLAALSVFSA